MDELFPSEIARLVLGYLKENKCEKSWKVFLEESSNLQEYCELYRKGKLYPTNVNGKSLLDILQEYCDFKKNAENNVNQFTEGTFKDRCKIILQDIVKDAAEHVLLKYFPSVSDKKYRKTNNPADVTKAIQTSGLTTNRCIEYGSVDESNDDHTPEASTVNDVANQSHEESNAEVNGTSHKLSLIESSVSGTIYLQEIIKVEKDNDSVSENPPESNISNIGCHTVKQKKLSNSFSECNNDLNSLTNNSKIIVENQSDADSTSELSKNADKAISLKQTTNSMEVEIIETVKLEPDSNVDSYKNGTSTNFIQNSSVITSQDSRGAVEINQTALCDTPNTVSQFSNLVNNIGFSTNQSGITLQSTPFSNQPMFPPVPTYIVPNYSSNTPYLQNNTPYSFVINAPSNWEETAVTGFSLNLPNIQQNNIGPILTSVDSLSSSASSVPTICVNSTLNPTLTPVEQIICTNNSSTTASSINNLSMSSSTTVDSAATGQSFTVSSVPSNVLSSINTAATVHTISNSKISEKVTSKSNTKLKDMQIPGKKTRGSRKKSELCKGKAAKIGEVLGQVQNSGKAASKKTKRSTLPSSSESRKKTRRKDK